MAHSDPLPTQRGGRAGIAAEVVAAGFEDPDEIGRGGFGVVYRCIQRTLDRTVAVKVLTTDLEPDNVERFVREQVAMGQLWKRQRPTRCEHQHEGLCRRAADPEGVICEER